MRQMRLFIAVNFPEQIKKALGAIIGELRQLPSDAKWVEEHNLHLTLQFLGNVPAEQVDSIAAALGRSAAGVAPFRLNLNGVGVFPSRARPRVLWAGVSGETAVLSRLQHRVQTELGQLGFPAEKRQFSPHLTLARFRSPAGFSAVMERAEEIVRGLDKFGSAVIDSVELMLSELGARGPSYFVLARTPLSGKK
ncbi:2'-5' RNA ligase [Pelotomaculum thermopropionicum SI]|uniref:RNA 2',3'-cyclic phosphodiesterase n=1 Tax=Pelotomaculum thermopropionicum (strain DSM 13744 / JCM 10971 / SI) TaxID=370438 RepID=A5D3U3_PELTS|nr:2'-5' RNA ligase [Pelotomaculum thermopropionicum SI]